MKFPNLLLTITAFAVLSGCATPTQMLYDAEVDRRCAMDGGIKVFEKVQLSPQEYDSLNSLSIMRIPTEKLRKPTDKYYFVYGSQTLIGKSGEDPHVWRSTASLYRATDNALLGTSVAYNRVGGDVPGPWHPSSYSCPKSGSFKGTVFVRASQ